jgi:hypothetical protein
MGENQKTIFVNGMYINKKQFGNGKELLNINVKTEQFIDFLNKNTNDKGYCKIAAFSKPEGSDMKYGTHSVQLDTWQPPSKPEARGNVELPDDGDLPF